MPIKIKDAVKETPAAYKLRRFLDRAPTDQVFSPREVEKGAGLGNNSIYGTMRYHDFSSYRLRLRQRVVYWGHPKAIAKLKKSLEAK